MTDNHMRYLPGAFAQEGRMPGDPRAQRGREIAAAALEHAADQLAAVKAAIAHGDGSQWLLRARRGRLEHAAVAYAVALGYRPPA